MRWWLALTLALVATGAAVDATFASAVGFSGRNADCTVCHSPASAQPATAWLDGLPATWTPDSTYSLTARVTGGPTPLLPDRPEGGFELEVESGKFAPGPGMDAKLRTPRDGVITYEPEGTLQRAWQVDWTAPSAWQEPVPVTFWLAAMAANGDHDANLNRSDGGERGDAVGSLVAVVQPDPDVVAAWQALPLLPPVIDAVERTDLGWRISGHHVDGNATGLGFQYHGLDGQQETGQAWVLEIRAERLDGTIWSQGAGRMSGELRLGEDVQSPAPGLWLPLLAALIWVRKRS